MNFRTAAFLTRSLRQESRFTSHHVMRAALALLIMLLFMAQVTMSTSRMGAGGQFASTVLYCMYWFLTVVGTIYFSTAIVEEKEEETLPLLRMTGASTFSILTGKSLPRLAVTLLFLLVIAPFLMLSVTLGGVLPYGLITSVLAILVYSFLLSQIGLLASVLCRDAPRAFTLAAVLWLTLEFSHWWSWMASQAALTFSGIGYRANAIDHYLSTEWSSDNWGTMMCLWTHIQLNALSEWLTLRVLLGNLSTMLMSFSSDDIWQPQITFHCAVAFAAFVLSWLLFDRCTSRAVGEGKAAPTTTQKKQRRRPSRRVFGPALAWKSWQFLTGGSLWMVLRAIALPLFITIVIAVVVAVFDGQMEFEDLGGSLFTIGIILLIINLARLLGRVFNDEIHGKTLNSLLMLPQPRSLILLQLVAGLIPAFVTACGTVFVGFVMLSIGDDFLNWFVDMLEEPWSWQVLLWAVATFHVGVLLSVYTRYGGMLLAVAFMWFMAPMIFFTLVAALAVIAGNSGWMDELMQWIVPLLLIPLTIGLCAATYWPILRRMESLGSR